MSLEIKHIEECPIVYGFELSNEEQKEFDYYSKDELDEALFVRYRNTTYDLGSFMRFTYGISAERIREGRFHPFGKEWNEGGYHADSFYSGVLCLILDETTVRMATYIS